MTEQEKKMESCHHVWQYAGRSFDDTFVCCPRCGMTRLAMPGETVPMVARPQKTKPEDGDRK